MSSLLHTVQLLCHVHCCGRAIRWDLTNKKLLNGAHTSPRPTDILYCGIIAWNKNGGHSAILGRINPPKLTLFSPITVIHNPTMVFVMLCGWGVKAGVVREWVAGVKKCSPGSKGRSPVGGGSSLQTLFAYFGCLLKRSTFTNVAKFASSSGALGAKRETFGV